MLKRWRKPAVAPVTATRAPRATPGKRAYAIGDVHGRLDLLDRLLGVIRADNARRPRVPTFLIFLGDLIDRGPDSAGVLARLIDADWDGMTPVFLMGNHEEMLLRALEDEPGVLAAWLNHGGLECAQSYGVPPTALLGSESAQGAAILRTHVPARHVAFVRDMADSFRFGDYLFVHAGIRPGVPIAQQVTRDLRWIREEFIDVPRDDALTVVHGHTIFPEPSQVSGRIGIDTGAYLGGPLTAIRIEGEERELFAVGG